MPLAESPFDLSLALSSFRSYVTDVLSNAMKVKRLTPQMSDDLRKRAQRTVVEANSLNNTEVSTAVKRACNAVVSATRSLEDDWSQEAHIEAQNAIIDAFEDMASRLKSYLDETESRRPRRTEEEMAEDPVDSDNVSQALASYRSIGSKLKASIKAQPLVFKSAPIVSMMAFQHVRLQSNGIPHTNLAGYTVLEERPVFGVGFKFCIAQIKTALKEGEEAPEFLALRRRGASDLDAIDDKTRLSVDKHLMAAVVKVAKDLLRTWKGRSGRTDWIAINEEPRIWGGGLWFWVEPRSSAKRLFASGFSSTGTPKNVSRWGFAFESSTALRSTVGATPRVG